MPETNDITGRILAAAVRTHRELGPGLLESAYQFALAAELAKHGLRFRKQVEVPLIYDGARLECSYRLDFLVEGRVIVEIKAIRALAPIHTAQLLTYLKLSGHTVGLLINFNTKYLGESAVRRIVNGYKGPLPRTPSAPR